MEVNKVDEIVEQYGSEKGALIAILHDAQSEYNYLPKEVLKRIAEKLDIPLSQAIRVASFFTAFSLIPRGRHLVNVCLGTACHVRGARRILGRLEKELGIKDGETSQDLMFTLRSVRCLGSCALGPIMVLDGRYFGKLSPTRVNDILKISISRLEEKNGKNKDPL